jgi:4-carboxymuconolactone decarboxylase
MGVTGVARRQNRSITMTTAPPIQPDPDLIRAIAPVAYHTAAGQLDALAGAVAQALRAAVATEARAAAIREVILQTYLFAGYPRTLNALRVFRDAATAAGLDVAALDADLPTELNHAACHASGEALFTQIYGAQRDAVKATAHALHPDLARWMIDEGYGRVLSRPNLPPIVREPAIVAALLPLDVPLQLTSHVLGSRNAGCNAATMALLRDALTACARLDELAALDAALTRAGLTR